MADIEFDDDGKVELLTRHHGKVVLSRSNWENHICGKPERSFYRLNGDKVATTLIGPDTVRCHSLIPTQYLYYKHFPKWQIVPGVEGPLPQEVNTMAVVIDQARQRVCTVYPVREPKPGKEYRP